MKKLILILALLLAGCGDKVTATLANERHEVILKPGRKFVDASWRTPSELWFLSRPMRKDEDAEVWCYKVRSESGQGSEIFFIEMPK